jgi:hypothetical protein
VIGAEAFPVSQQVLTWSAAVGPLSGTTTVAMGIWLVTWAALHGQWRGRQLRFRPVATWIVTCLLLGILGTFPPVYDGIARVLKGLS